MSGVNYNDERFVEVERDKQQALTENEKLYDNMINQSDQYFDAQIDASKQWTQQQQQIQQEQTDFAIEQIEQQKQQAEKDYQKEQSAAFVDYKKQSNQYSAEAERMATSGLTNTGFSETSQVSMFNTYQNRIAMARESINKATLNYDNAMKEARLQNSSALAEIAFNAYQKELEIALQGFQYKNQLNLDKANQKQQIENNYYGRYQDVLAQINQEIAQAEQIRQYNENLRLQQQQMEYQKAQDERNYQLQLQQLAEEKRQFDASLAASQSSGSSQLYAVSTAYYQGDLNKDAEVYGTFANGYQPKGISGHGTLSKTGKTVPVETQYQYGPSAGQSVTVKQNIWKAKDGTLWLWDGRNNRYIPYE